MTTIIADQNFYISASLLILLGKLQVLFIDFEDDGKLRNPSMLDLTYLSGCDRWINAKILWTK